MRAKGQSSLGALPRAAQAQCRRGLRMLMDQPARWRTMAVIARTIRLARGEPVDQATLSAMQAFFSSHDCSYGRYDRLAALLWGGEPGRLWAQAQTYQADAAGATVPRKGQTGQQESMHQDLVDFIAASRRQH